MYCPNCSNKISLDQKFCRTCGLGLEKIAQSLAEQLPTQLNEDLLAKKDRLERLGVTALSVFGLGLLGLLIYMVGYKLIAQGRLLAALGIIGLIVLVGSGLLSVILFAKANEMKEESNKRRLEQPEEASLRADTAKLLQENRLEPVPSITEHTTELLRTDKTSL
jgi:hypothetical protein